jgi:hypothetical protein
VWITWSLDLVQLVYWSCTSLPHVSHATCMPTYAHVLFWLKSCLQSCESAVCPRLSHLGALAVCWHWHLQIFLRRMLFYSIMLSNNSSNLGAYYTDTLLGHCFSNHIPKWTWSHLTMKHGRSTFEYPGVIG